MSINSFNKFISTANLCEAIKSTKLHTNATHSSSQYTRTVDDVKSMIKLAKLRESQLTDVTQVIYYGESEINPDWKLLELNPQLLKAIEDGNELSFKG